MHYRASNQRCIFSVSEASDQFGFVACLSPTFSFARYFALTVCACVLLRSGRMLVVRDGSDLLLVSNRPFRCVMSVDTCYPKEYSNSRVSLRSLQPDSSRWLFHVVYSHTHTLEYLLVASPASAQRFAFCATYSRPAQQSLAAVAASLYAGKASVRRDRTPAPASLYRCSKRRYSKHRYSKHRTCSI